MRHLLFRPMFSAMDLATGTLTGTLMFTGHFLASLPIAAVGVAIGWFGRTPQSRPHP